MSLRPVTQQTGSTCTVSSAEDAGHRESETEAPGGVAEEEEEERDVQRIEDDIAEVEAERVLETEQAGVEGPAHVP